MVVVESSAMVDALVGDPANPTVHDAAYLVLAQALEAPIVSADAKLTQATRRGIDVRILD